MAQSSDRPLGERLQIAVFALGSIHRREEVEFLRLGQNSSYDIFADECFAAKSEFDLEKFREE